METYVYRNLNSCEIIIERLKSLMEFEILSDVDGYSLFSDILDVDINKKYTSFRVKDSTYNIRELKRIVVER